MINTYYLDNIQLEVLPCGQGQWDTVVKPVKLEHNLFCYVIKGELDVQTESSEMVAVDGDLLLLSIGSKQNFTVKQQDMNIKTVCFTAICNDKDLLELLKLPNKISIGYNSEIDKMITDISLLGGKKDIVSVLRQKSCLFDLISFYIKTSPYKIRHENYDKCFTDIFNYIGENLSREITIQELADIAHFHPNYFCRFFKRHTSLAPMDFIAVRRMDRAKDLVLNTQMPISEIALMTGHSDYNYFSRQFKNATGFTPSDYRKLNENNQNPD